MGCAGCLCTCAPATACSRGAVCPQPPAVGPLLGEGKVSSSLYLSLRLWPLSLRARLSVCRSLSVVTRALSSVTSHHPLAAGCWDPLRPPYAGYLMDGTRAVPGGTGCRPARWGRCLETRSFPPEDGRTSCLLGARYVVDFEGFQVSTVDCLVCGCLENWVSALRGRCSGARPHPCVSAEGSSPAEGVRAPVSRVSG